MADESFKDYVLDQLAGLGRVTARAMFGGHAVYKGEDFFGIVQDGRLYFRTDETTREAYIEQGSNPFQPNPRQTLRSYYEVPADVLESEDRLVEWASNALEAQRAARKSDALGARRATAKRARAHGD
jgi:DNA transformation protein and related proteins